MKTAATIIVALALLATIPVGARADNSSTLTYTPAGYAYQYITGPEHEDATSYNKIRITNTGTTSITRISFSQQHTYWRNTLGPPYDTDYAIHGNTWIEMIPGHWVAMSVPAIERAYTDWTPGTYKDYPMRVTNPTLPEGTYYFTMAVTLTYQDSQQHMYLVTPQYNPYLGQLAMGRFYDTGSGFTYPTANPGDLDVTTTNTCIVYNKDYSAFPVSKLTFMLSEMNNGMGQTQKLGGNARILYESIYHDDWYEFPLIDQPEYSLCGTAVAEVTLGGAQGPDTPPPYIAPGDNFAFKIRIDELPEMTTGTWAGTWHIIVHGNPITTIGGWIGDPRFETYVITPTITNDTGGTLLATGTPTTFNFSITHNNGPASLYTNYTTLVYDKWGNRITRLEWHTTRNLRTASDPLVYVQPLEPPAPTYTFQNPGLYDVYIIPKDNYDHKLQWQHAAYEEIVITGEPTPTTPTSTGSTIVYAGFCLLFILLAKTVLIVYYITDYKQHKDTYHRGDKR